MKKNMKLVEKREPEIEKSEHLLAEENSKKKSEIKSKSMKNDHMNNAEEIEIKKSVK
jgi:hypothetical protein